MGKLPTDFIQIKNLEKLKDYLSEDKITVKITFWGGRKFKHKGSKGDLTLNDIVRMFGKKVYDSRYGGGKYSQEKRDLVNKISLRLGALDTKGKDKLKKKGWLTRLMHKIRKSAVVLKIEDDTYTRKNVLEDIKESLRDLETRENQILLRVETRFDESFGTDAYGYTPFPTLTQELDDTKSAFTEFVKNPKKQKAKEFRIEVQKLSKSAQKLSDDDSKTFNNKLIELIHKLATDEVITKNGLKLSGFMLAMYCCAIGKKPSDFVVDNQNLKKIRDFDILKNYTIDFYKKSIEPEESGAKWWPYLNIEHLEFPDNLQRLRESFE